jgi:hypothetical protein
MAVLSTTTKAKAVKGAVKYPVVLRATGKTAKPVVKARVKRSGRKARRQAVSFGEGVRDVTETLVTYGPPAAQELGLIEPPKQKKTLPRVIVGIIIGAAAVLLLDPKNREKVTSLAG